MTSRARATIVGGAAVVLMAGLWISDRGNSEFDIYRIDQIRAWHLSLRVPDCNLSRSSQDIDFCWVCDTGSRGRVDDARHTAGVCDAPDP